MENAIKHLRIQNFKSIKDVTLKPRRVNIIIGEPNVGKSNILEAMSLLGGMLIDQHKFMDGQIRYETVRNLFYDNDWTREIIVSGEGVGATRIRRQQEQAQVAFGDGEFRRNPLSIPTISGLITSEIAAAAAAMTRQLAGQIADGNLVVDFDDRNHLLTSVNLDGSTGNQKTSSPPPFPRVKKYSFQKHMRHGRSYAYSFLRPPFGDNLLDVIQSGTPAFRKEVAAFFTEFGFNLSLRTEERILEIQKNVDGLITAIPYSLIADTLQRIIFYLAAIESNNDAIILLEEPEAHSYPVYVSRLGRHIVESRNNQFFLITHSDYLVTEILEEMLTKDEYAGELAIFAAYYEDYQTKVHQLSDQEILDIRADGIDVFYNMERFTTGRENG